MERYAWGRLSKQQVGAYAEYFVKMELTMYGFQVYGTEVDDRGIDFVARHENGPFIEVQVKSAAPSATSSVQKTKFKLRPSLYLALALLLEEGRPPELYLIPSLVWEKPDSTFVSRDYRGLESKPEWGLNLSNKNMSALQPYRFEQTIRDIGDKASKQE